MKRLTLQYLQRWRLRIKRAPLLVRGARQVGKTWLIREFAKNFRSFVEINLESDVEYHQPFREFFGKPDDLIRTLSLLSGKKITPGETLLFLDEIQASKEVLLALRYFKEKLPTLHVIAAGSLLEFTIQDLSFPVGRIEFFHLFPLNFEEYLLALGREDLLSAVREADASKPLPVSVHQLLLEEVSHYGLMGGMPEVVSAYVETKDLSEVQVLQQRLISNFREDFYKYAKRAQLELLRKLFDGIPRLLGQKFKYSHVDPEVRSREMGIALDLLVDAGLAYKIRHTSAQGIPLASQVKESKFKVFALDIGLALRLLGLNLSQLFPERKSLLANRGALAEQFVAQEILSYTPDNDTPRLHYWHRESKSSQAEVDFVIEREASIMPIEVKSEKGGRMKSLNLFIQEHQKFVKSALKISSENFQSHGLISTYPFYAVSKIFSVVR